MNAPLLLSPSDAQEQYDLSPSLLRRYALIFEEELGGTINRDKRGGRLYTPELLEHFKQATERVAMGETVADALRTLHPSETLAAQEESLSETALSGEVLEVLRQVLSTQETLVSEVRGFREELREASAVKAAELEVLRREVAELKTSRGGVVELLERVRGYVVERVRRKL